MNSSLVSLICDVLKLQNASFSLNEEYICSLKCDPFYYYNYYWPPLV